MALKPLTSEAIALTEKKMDMALDDIIKMSKNSSNKNKEQRVPNKNHGVFKGNGSKRNNFMVRRYLDSRTSIRQGALVQKRSNFRGNQFPVTTKVAKQAVGAPVRKRFFNNNRMVNRNQYRFRPPTVQRNVLGQDTAIKEQAKALPRQKPSTLDARFANLREHRMKLFPAENNSRRLGGGRQQFQRRRNQFGK